MRGDAGGGGATCKTVHEYMFGYEHGQSRRMLGPESFPRHTNPRAHER